MAEIAIEAGGVTLAGEESGEGTPVVLLHGLTASRRYVVMGSRALQRDGHRVVAYDARGHGASSPAPSPEAYRYEDLAADLLAVLDDRGIERALLAGASMGAHTIVRFALDHGDRVAGLVVDHARPSTPTTRRTRRRRLGRWDALSEGLRDGRRGGLRRGLRHPEVARALARDDLQGAAPAARRPRAPRGGRRRAARRPALAARSRPGRSSPSSRCPRSSSRAATRPTPSTPTRSASATRRRSRAPSCAPRSPARRRWPGRAASSPR